MKKLLCVPLFLLLLLLSACGSKPVTISGTIVSTGESVQDSSSPYSYNSIPVAVDNQAFRIANVSLSDRGKVIFPDGSEKSLSDVKAGWKIAITFDGRVMESFPVQIIADKITVISVE